MRKSAEYGNSHILLPLLVVVLASVIFAGWKVYSHQHRPYVDLTNPTKFITADYIDSSKIFSISKFRSLEGHDFSGGGETCRSMKHYFIPQLTSADSQLIFRNNGTPPGPDGKTDIDIFSPTTGKIVKIQSERTPVGEQIYIVPDATPGYTIRLFHIFKSSSIKKGSHVTAGQKIGVVGRIQTSDVAIEANDTYVSYFTVMTDQLFAKYQARGVANKEQIVLSREYRDANAVTCDQDKNSNQAFHTPPNRSSDEDEVRLSGYIAPVYDSPDLGSQSNKTSQSN